ncbi:MAG: hypothetical protein LBC27_02370 [Spirochaetaceae bacterium]|jgi:tetratricopeptide (TPR) repeat protein|nr:hypothetical protein [Spirochaetaceae bacterium]
MNIHSQARFDNTPHGAFPVTGNGVSGGNDAKRAQDAFSGVNTGIRFPPPQKRILSAELTRAISLNPNDTEAYCRRVLLYYGKGEHNNAINDCVQVMNLAPNNAEAYYKRAVADINQVIKIGRNHAGILKNLMILQEIMKIL